MSRLQSNRFQSFFVRRVSSLPNLENVQLSGWVKVRRSEGRMSVGRKGEGDDEEEGEQG